MDARDRIIYSQEEMLRSLDCALEEMGAFRYDARYRRLGGAFADKCNRSLESIARHRANPFTLAVVGEFKRGKSSLINALLQEDVATIDVTTETVTVNRISYGTEANEAVLSKGRRVRLAKEELRRENLEKVLAGFDEPITQLELRRPNDFLQKVTVIDTPGLEDAMKDFSEQVADALLQADAIIYVFKSSYPISMTEQFFLRSTLLPGSFTGLFLVGNFADNLETTEVLERMRRSVQKRLQGLLPGAKVYMVSALDELSRQRNLKRPEPDMAPTLEAEFSSLRQDVERLVEEKGETCVLDRMQRLSLSMVDELDRELKSIRAGLSMDEEKREEALSKLREEKETSQEKQRAALERVKNKITVMESEGLRWIQEFLDRIVEETENLDGEDGDVLRRYYEFYCVDLVEQAMSVCIDYHREQLYDLLDDEDSSLTGKIGDMNPGKQNYRIRFKLDNRVWTKGDNVGLVVSCLKSGGGGFLGTIANMAVDAVSGYMREKEMAKKTPDFVEEIRRKMIPLYDSVEKNLREMYRSLGKKLEMALTEYYEGELESKEHYVEQAVSVSEKEAAAKEEIALLVEEAQGILQKVRFAAEVKHG